MLKKWEDLPEFMRCEEVREYYEILHRKRFSLLLKRVFDVVVASIMLVIFAVPMLIIAIIIKLDSPGPVFYRQERMTTNGKIFRIHKFRTMVNNAEMLGASITVNGDSRITKVGKVLRGLRIDEFPQLIDVLFGDMTFVGTRPEAKKYFEAYTKEMRATLLLPAGITSEASIRYKDEASLLDATDNVDETYVKIVLPEKMKYNLDNIKNISLLADIVTMFRTVLAVVGKEK